MVKLVLNRSYTPDEDSESSSQTSESGATGVDLTAKDSTGCTVLHHLAAPLAGYTYLNSDVILRIIWPAVRDVSNPETQLMDVANNEGQTAYKIAVDRNARHLIHTFRELSKSESTQPPAPVLPAFPKIETNFLSEEFDYKSDAKKMCEQLDAEVMETDAKEAEFIPDPHVGVDGAYVLTVLCVFRIK
jgi:hypothetical protein